MADGKDILLNVTLVKHAAQALENIKLQVSKKVGNSHRALRVAMYCTVYRGFCMTLEAF